MFLKQSFELNFGSNQKFPDSKVTKKIQAYIHNQCQRVSIVFPFFGAFTFELKEAKTTSEQADWSGTVMGKNFNSEMKFYFEDMKLNMEGFMNDEDDQ